MSNEDKLAFVGFDIGGSKTDLVADIPDLDIPVRMRAAGENFQTAGADGAARDIISLVHQIRMDTGFEGSFNLAIGIAGAGRPEERKQLEGAICSLLGDDMSRLEVFSDAEIALEGAFTGESGMIVIAGTGSGVYARDRQGGFHRAGGWGPVIGDPGSGTQLGLQGLRAATRAMDGGATTTLQTGISEKLGVVTRSEMIESVYTKGIRFADLAPLVLEAASGGDHIAVRLVHREARALAREASAVASSCNTIEPRIALIGGLCDNDFYREALGMALLNATPDFHIEPPEATPSEGALSLARTIR